MSQKSFFNRPPRIQLELPENQEMDIPVPPAPTLHSGWLGLFSVALPLLTILGYALVASRGGNILFILPMGVAAIFTSVVGFLNWRRNNMLEKQKAERYQETIHNLEAQMKAAHEKQRDYYNYTYPEPVTLMEWAKEKGSRLWERRRDDPDFGCIRVGVGNRRSHVQFRPPTVAADNGSPHLIDALKLIRSYTHVKDLPLDVSLIRQPVLGICGKTDSVTGLARAMLIGLCATHSPDDTQVYVAGVPRSQSGWDWAAWLPHCGGSQGKGSSQQLCFSLDQMQGFWALLQNEIERRKSIQENLDSTNTSQFPLLLVVVDLTGGSDSNLIFEKAIAEGVLSTLLNTAANLATSMVFLVNEEHDVPGECGAIIRLEQNNNERSGCVFTYLETGLNTVRLNGDADQISQKQAQSDFSRRLTSVAVRATYGADLPLSVSLLELHNAASVYDLPIQDHWKVSNGAHGDAPGALIGMMRGGKSRELFFQTDRDGDHALVAGTTGSGKSELLVALILGIALRHSPSMVNFVLVDYKGGTAFSALRELPHVVDVITNLHGRLGTRAFAALRAAIAGRNRLLSEQGKDDIRRYRAENLHATFKPLPYLFIIVDEFAEMIKERPEFRPPLETIARLGRASGVHLILAAQQPRGLVSDQIRANVDIKICLRVQSLDDSRELLGVGDAALLPNVPGRGYLLTGKDRLDLVQIAHARAGYRSIGDESDTSQPIQDVSMRGASTIAGALVSQMIDLAKSTGIPPQHKPWCDPLPETLPISDSRLASPLRRWMEAYEMGKWTSNSSGEIPLRIPIGLVDQPIEARQFPLEVDLALKHYLVAGTSGSGVTTLIRTVVLSLAALNAPDRLHVYALDFSGGGLDILRDLPHVGDVITPVREEETSRLLRTLLDEIEQRKSDFSKLQAQVESLDDYNQRVDEDLRKPAVLLIVDNINALKDTMPDVFEDTVLAARDGRGYGVHLLLTTEQPTLLPPKLMGLLPGRLALYLADKNDYVSAIGRLVADAEEIAGRGYTIAERFPLEFQVAVPIEMALSVTEVPLSTARYGNPEPISAETGDVLRDDTTLINDIVVQMANAWRGKGPTPIGKLPSIIPLSTLPHSSTLTLRGRPVQIAVQDSNLQPFIISLDRNPHVLIIGPPVSGKTTILQSWMLALSRNYATELVQLWLIDVQGRLADLGEQQSLAKLHHCNMFAKSVSEIDTLIKELQGRLEIPNERVEHFVFIDSYDDMVATLSTRRDVISQLGVLARQYGSTGLHFVIAGSRSLAAGSDDLTRVVAARRFGLALDGSECPAALGARLRNAQLDLPPGRGYFVSSGNATLVQFAIEAQGGARQS